MMKHFKQTNHTIIYLTFLLVLLKLHVVDSFYYGVSLRRQFLRDGKCMTRLSVTINSPDKLETVKFPIKVKDVVSRLTQSTQLAIQEKLSRLEVQLPPQFDLGLNEREPTVKESETTRTNREIARLFFEMFAVLKDTSAVIFPTEQEAKLAEKLWSKKKFDRKILYFSERIDIKSLSKAERKSYDERRMIDPNFNPDIYLTLKPDVPKNTEVLVIVSPQLKDYPAIMSLHQEFGLGTLILLVNPRFVWSDLMEQRSKGISTSNEKAPEAAKEENKDIEKTYSFGKRKSDKKDVKANEPAIINTLGKDYQQMADLSKQFPNSFYYSPPVLANQRLMNEITKSRQILLFHENTDSDWFLIEKLTSISTNQQQSSNNPMNALTAMMTNLVDKLDESKTVKVLLRKSTKPTEEEVIKVLKETE